ncbi:MAG: D-alanine--D-alanine ligase [Ferruginibacter sp.]|nr:D-alanine--D-alanine ligase [Ferruginibacter sp.]
MQKQQKSTFLIKLFNWEYWSFGVVYAPIYLYWFYLCLRARNLFFFSASNPSIENAGFLMEKKSDIYDIIPTEYYPKTLLIKEGLSASEIHDQIIAKQFCFPLIVKPDIGGKGRGVKKIENIEDAVRYIKYAQFPMLVQALVDYKNEAGIFYYRYPWQENGKISGIVSKEFLAVIGDGVSTIEQLVMQNERYVLQLNALKKMPEINLQEILEINVEKIMVPFGNHARGAKFIDVSNKITLDLEKSINEICKKIPEFYFGRLDIMYSNWQELVAGKNLSIIELNGAGSEPTHIYDPKHSIFFAWKEIARHLKILYRISVYNHTKNKIPYLSFKNGLKMFKEVKGVEKRLDNLL